MQTKEIRKNANRLAIGLIFYTIICQAVFLLESLFHRIYADITEPDADARNALLQQLEERSYSSGISSIIGITAGVLLLFLYARKRLPLKTAFQKEQAMTGKKFLLIFCTFMSGQLIFSLLGNLLEAALNLCGLTAMGQLEAASAQSTTLSMLLYSGLFAPVAEELIYRGFVLRSLERYGRTFAIAASAALFGIMHGNLFQMLFAFLVGLVLGYTALTYSIRWSILLHIINNLIFGEFLSWLLSPLSAAVQDYIYRGINILFFATAAFWLLKRRDRIVQYLQKHRSDKKCWLHTFTAAAMLLFVVYHLWLAVSGIHPLSSN